MMNIDEAKEKLVAAVKEFVNSVPEGSDPMDFDEYCHWVDEGLGVERSQVLEALDAF